MKNSKKEERIIILNMLKDGKITVDESIKLLNALDSGEESSGSFDFDGSINMDDKFEKFTSTLDSFAKDVGEKAKTTYKDLEPKLKSGTKTVIEKTISVLGDINQSLTESLENMKKSENEEHNCGGNCDCGCDEHKEENHQ